MPRPNEFKMTARDSNDHGCARTTRNYSIRLVFSQHRATYIYKHCDAVFILDTDLMKRLIVVGACYIDTILRSVHNRYS
jgi:hypothetical protein